MVFKRKESFFLDLGGQDAAGSGVSRAPVRVATAVAPPAANVPDPVPAVAPAQAASAPEPAAPAPTASGPVPTTAEAIAAELRAAQAARPAPSLSTFAADALNPGNAVPLPRRRAGANLSGFKAMARSMTGTGVPAASG
jgi:hypothetical protein